MHAGPCSWPDCVVQPGTNVAQFSCQMCGMRRTHHMCAVKHPGIEHLGMGQDNLCPLCWKQASDDAGNNASTTHVPGMTAPTWSSRPADLQTSAPCSSNSLLHLDPALSVHFAAVQLALKPALRVLLAYILAHLSNVLLVTWLNKPLGPAGPPPPELPAAPAHRRIRLPRKLKPVNFDTPEDELDRTFKRSVAQRAVRLVANCNT